MLRPTEDGGRSTSIFSLYWHISQGQMANFPAFVASKLAIMIFIPVSNSSHHTVADLIRERSLD